MSLRFLEQLTRRWKRGWSLVDLGTGSGILALAAKYFGAGRVIGIDNDPAAISVAKSNARLNKIRGASFSIRRCAQMEPGTEDRCDHGKFIQRFAYRNPAETTRRRVANSLRHFAQPTRRIGSRPAAEPPRHHQREASREMDCHSGEAERHSATAGTSSRQIFAAVDRPPLQ